VAIGRGAPQMVERDAAMQAVLGASTAVAGLTLVFQGYLFTVYTGLQPGDHPSVKARYRWGVTASLVPLSLSIFTALGALGWLLGLDLFWATIAGFMLSIVLLLVASILVTLNILR
jgi:hypothetical protein